MNKASATSFYLIEERTKNVDSEKIFKKKTEEFSFKIFAEIKINKT